MRKKVKGAVFTIEVAFFVLAVALIAGYMFSNYQPMMLNEWIEIDRKRRARMMED